ncbi:MAG: hypothetical protein K0U76_02930 [Actinomycetia bacterium]|nr:hypothetical protein [Actinomycetes bacterium]MCH9700331.1 hypothetical protein [Actinomycetes bacterium]MCH9760577.1 hypothetical protein [Actinomycetes bacterium]
MSWLLVALIPGLLMLATLGLARVESSLHREAIPVADVDEFLDQAGAGDLEALARGGMSGALRSMQRHLDEWDCGTGILADHLPDSDSAAHQDFPGRANPEFQQTRHANPV